MNVQSRIDLPRELSVEAFFEWAEAQADRYELVEGTPRLQPWVKRNHSKIASNVSFLLQSQLDRQLFDVHQGDFAVCTGPDSIRYADVLVEPSGGSGDARMADHACLIVEVLSPSTAAEDLGPKLDEYLGIASLRVYLILAQDEPCAWLWARGAGNEWPTTPRILRTGSVVCEELDLDLSLADVYRGIAFDAGH